MSALLSVDNLSIDVKTQDGTRPLIQKIGFTIDPGTCVALVGESGSGKTLSALTMMQLLPESFLVHPDSQIHFQGQDILCHSERVMRRIRGQEMAMIFQDAMSAFNPVFTIGHQIIEALRCHVRISKTKAKQRVMTLFEEVGIQDPKRCYQAYPHQLSGGMLQRAMIAMALIGDPQLLIADEPTTALDVTIQAQVLSLLKTIQQQHHMAILFISHDLAVVSQLADHIIVMQSGNIVEQNTTADFFKNPTTAYSQRLLAAIPSTTPKMQAIAQEKLLLDATHLKVYFPIRKGIFKRVKGFVKAVDDIALKIPIGETLALVGESGSGKTTTARALLKLTAITEGNVTFEQRDIAKLSGRQFHPLRKDIQIIFQDPYAALNPRRRVADSIAEGLLTQKIVTSQQAALDKVDELLTLVELDPKNKWRYPHEFSGGQRQRICIARAIGLKPKLLILDEPTSALDVSIQLQVLDLLIGLQQSHGFTYLLITHNLGVVAYMAHHTAVMHHGHIVEQGTTQAILQAPQQTYTQKLLAAMPTLAGTTHDK